MSKPLPILALVVAQLLTWSGAPLYLCLSCDGSMRFDNGPASCNCPHHEHESASTTACGDHCHCGDRALTTRAEKVHSPCDCAHIRLSQEQQLVAGAGNRLPSDHAAFAPALADRVIASDSCGWQAVTQSAGPPTIDSGPLADLSSIILRC